MTRFPPLIRLLVLSACKLQQLMNPLTISNESKGGDFQIQAVLFRTQILIS
jgi:hypothetical protein